MRSFRIPVARRREVSIIAGMSKKPIVAILYDFDSTLSPTDMQA